MSFGGWLWGATSQMVQQVTNVINNTYNTYDTQQITNNYSNYYSNQYVTYQTTVVQQPDPTYPLVDLSVSSGPADLSTVTAAWQQWADLYNNRLPAYSGQLDGILGQLSGGSI